MEKPKVRKILVHSPKSPAPEAYPIGEEWWINLYVKGRTERIQLFSGDAVCYSLRTDRPVGVVRSA